MNLFFPWYFDPIHTSFYDKIKDFLGGTWPMFGWNNDTVPITVSFGVPRQRAPISVVLVLAGVTDGSFRKLFIFIDKRKFDGIEMYEKENNMSFENKVAAYPQENSASTEQSIDAVQCFFFQN